VASRPTADHVDPAGLLGQHPDAVRRRAQPAADLEFGPIVASEIEAPTMLENMV
jgi:hypothetical protein